MSPETTSTSVVISENETVTLANIEKEPDGTLRFTVGREPPLASSSCRPQRQKRPRIEYGDDPEVWQLERRLLWNDAKAHETYGKRILELRNNQEPLSPPLRKQLVRIACNGLMDYAEKVNKGESSRPTVPQRAQMAETIVETVYGFLTPDGKIGIKNSLFAPGVPYVDAKGKKRTSRPMGYINTWFYNHWKEHKDKQPNSNAVEELPEEDLGAYSLQEMEDAQLWMQSRREPDHMVQDKLRISRQLREPELKSSSFSVILKNWPRLFDSPGGVFNEFDSKHVAICDGMIVNWNATAIKIVEYANKFVKTVTALNIEAAAADNKKELAAFFFLPMIFGAKSRKNATQLDSAKEFIQVHTSLEGSDIKKLESEKKLPHPEVHVVGNIRTLEFQNYLVIYEGKSIACDNLLQCLDLAFKSFKVFNIHYPAKCNATWEFIGHYFFKMRPTEGTLMSKILEVGVYLSHVQ